MQARFERMRRVRVSVSRTDAMTTTPVPRRRMT
jgi:hypothetical protein